MYLILLWRERERGDHTGSILRADWGSGFG